MPPHSSIRTQQVSSQCCVSGTHTTKFVGPARLSELADRLPAPWAPKRTALHQLRRAVADAALGGSLPRKAERA